MTYSKVKFKKPIGNAKNYFPTQEIRAKGFARELKSLILNKPIEDCLEQPEHETVLNTLNHLILNSDAVPSSLKKKHILDKKSEDFVSPSRLSEWWNGKAFPTSKNKEILDMVFPKLTNKWFERKSFTHRFQIHLASLDLQYIDSIDSEYAEYEATKMIETIILDWKPKGHRSSRDLIISGPIERSGFNFKEYELMKSFKSPSTIQNINDSFTQKYKKKMKIKYDLTIGKTSSYVGINLPKPIAEIYQINYPLSIVPYMFTLLCLSEDNESNYKSDLFLDFLSLINCTQFLLFKEYGGVFDFDNDRVGGHILALFLQINDFYYDDYWSIEKQKSRSKKSKEFSEKMKLDKSNQGLNFIPIPDLSILNYPALLLTDTLEDIIKSEASDDMEPYTTEEINELTLQVPQLLVDFREFYFNLFKITGHTEDQIVSKLLKKFKSYTAEDGSGVTTYSSTRENLIPSPYA